MTEKRTNELVAAMLCSAALAVVLAGCGGSSTPSASLGANPRHIGARSGGSSGTPTFTVQVSFTGQDALQGSFTDNQTGSGFSSCSRYASETGIPFYGPSPPPATSVNGKAVIFILTVASAAFHGPGTYTATMAAGVTIAGDSFLPQNNSPISATINADGSGHASFSNFYQLSGSGQGTESGTVTWTCAG